MTISSKTGERVYLLSLESISTLLKVWEGDNKWRTDKPFLNHMVQMGILKRGTDNTPEFSKFVFTEKGLQFMRDSNEACRLVYYTLTVVGGTNIYPEDDAK